MEKIFQNFIAIAVLMIATVSSTADELPANTPANVQRICDCLNNQGKAANCVAMTSTNVDAATRAAAVDQGHK